MKKYFLMLLLSSLINAEDIILGKVLSVNNSLNNDVWDNWLLDNELRELLNRIKLEFKNNLSDDLKSVCVLAHSKIDISEDVLENIITVLDDFVDENKNISSELKSDIKEYLNSIDEEDDDEDDDDSEELDNLSNNKKL